jgi:hypothetical protein
MGRGSLGLGLGLTQGKLLGLQKTVTKLVMARRLPAQPQPGEARGGKGG